MNKSAHFSRCRRYRYALWRRWEESKPIVMFIGLNPSTADQFSDDPTLTRCIRFARSWGFGSVCMANLFAYRATQPADMKRSGNPVGNYNNHWLKKLARRSDMIIAAWGNDGQFLNRSQQVKTFLPNLHYLKLNQSGEPAHPLYLRSSLKPVPWQRVDLNDH